MTDNTVRVMARFRPLNQQEQQRSQNSTCINFDTSNSTVVKHISDSRFNLFLDPNSTAIEHVLTFHYLIQSSFLSSYFFVVVIFIVIFSIVILIVFILLFFIVIFLLSSTIG